MMKRTYERILRGAALLEALPVESLPAGTAAKAMLMNVAYTRHVEALRCSMRKAMQRTGLPPEEAEKSEQYAEALRQRLAQSAALPCTALDAADLACIIEAVGFAGTVSVRSEGGYTELSAGEYLMAVAAELTDAS
ncbi:MAG: hypothetical protein NC193_09945 [bacterium]|nr:hypothetical protein [bacterium]